MTFINLSLLLGLGLAAVPVAVHLMMRSRPKKIEFPALRLLTARRTTNARRMKLRHLLLLLLRIAVLVAIVLALTRPSLPPARYRLLWYEWLLLLSVIAAAALAYRFLSHKLAAGEPASFVLREQLARLRAGTVVAGILTVFLIVGLPWGLRVRAEAQSPRSDLAEDIPVAAVFVFDTSTSMSYRHESVTRLEHAKQVASDHLQGMPHGSRVAVTGTAPSDDVVFQADLAGAHSRIEGIQTKPRIDSLNSILRKAVEAQRYDQQLVRDESGTSNAGDLFSREVFIFTDLSETAWSMPDEGGLRDLLLEYNWLHVFLVDVSVDRPINLSLQNLKLSDDTTVAGRSIDLSVDVVRTADAATSVNVEVFLLSDTGTETRPVAPQHVTLQTESATAHLSVPITDSAEFQTGIVRLSSTDPLQADDLRYFSLGVQPRPKVLIIADHRKDAYFLEAALEANDGSPTSPPYYDCTFVPLRQLHRQTLASFDVICFVNCQRPSRDDWDALHDWVDRGGGLLTVVGGAQTLKVDPWCVDESKAVLPAWLLVEGRYSEQSESLAYKAPHPITRAFDYDQRSKTDLLAIPIRRRWKVDIEPFPDSRVIMSYTGRNSSPALLERRVGNGRSVMLTTAVDYTYKAREQWNELPDSYTFMLLAEGIVQYLSGASEHRRNFVAGDPVEIQLPAARQFDRYFLRRPGPRQTSEQLDSLQRSVLIDDADAPGHYLVMSPPDSETFRFEFAVNANDEESNLAPITVSDLDAMLGEDRYSLVSEPAELRAAVRQGTLGIEVFPILVGLLVILFCAEHLMANYFYDQEAIQTDLAW
jgi:hypothetical protein